MKIAFAVVIGVLFFSCTDKKNKTINVQNIVDKSIKASGGELFRNHEVSFVFRDKKYVSTPQENGFQLSRFFSNDSVKIKDVKVKNLVVRNINDEIVSLNDSLSKIYANSINSVHYFSKLPFGLNDVAVNKKLLNRVTIGNQEYFKIEVTFNEKGGGDDFDDVYIYWINTLTNLPDFLAYSFSVNGGGSRFRVAYNERYINGIRFVDYKNFKPLDESIPVQKLDSLFIVNKLKLLSTIELKEIMVNPGNYN